MEIGICQFDSELEGQISFKVTYLYKLLDVCVRPSITAISNAQFLNFCFSEYIYSLGSEFIFICLIKNN